MSEYDDEIDKQPRAPRRTSEGVRIIGADEAAAALEEGKVVGRRPEDAPRFGDVPERPKGPTPGYRFPLPESADPGDAFPRPSVAGRESSPDMPHWTEPPTGEVPSVLAPEDQGDDLGAWSALSGRGPRWRDKSSDWEDGDFDDVAALADDETRLGALDVNRTEHSDLFSFDDPEPTYVSEDLGEDEDVEPIAVRPTRIHTRSPAAGPDGVYGRPRGGGGGRDMGTAVGVGVAIAMVALICFKLGPATTLLLTLVIVTAAAMEAFAALRRAGYQPATLLGLAGTVSLLLAVYKRGTAAYPLVMAMFVIFAFLWYLLGVVRARVTINVAVTFFAFFWVAGLGSFAALMLGLPHRQGIAVLLGAVLCTVAYDVGGLFFGGQMGSRPLMPEVSPNKTMEGLAGGMASAAVVGLVLGLALKPWSPGTGLLLGLVVAAVAPLGDLCESLVKRDIGVKDMGAVLPGHGGVLDRFDALLFVLPAAYYLALLLHFNQFKP